MSTTATVIENSGGPPGLPLFWTTFWPIVHLVLFYPQQYHRQVRQAASQAATQCTGAANTRFLLQVQHYAILAHENVNPFLYNFREAVAASSTRTTTDEEISERSVTSSALWSALYNSNPTFFYLLSIDKIYLKSLIYY